MEFITKIKNNIFVLALLLSLLAAVLIVFFPNSLLLGLLIASGIFIFTFYNFPLAIYFLIFISLIIPEGSGAAAYFSLSARGVSIYFEDLILLSILAAFVLQLLLRKIKLENILKSKLSLLIGLFVVWEAGSCLVGLRAGATFSEVIFDVRGIVYYLMFFVALCTLTKDNIEGFKRAVIYGSAAFALLFLVIYYFEPLIVASFGFDFPGAYELRFNFRNTSIFFLPVAFILSELIIKKKDYWRLALLLFLILAGVILSETRTLWLAVGLVVAIEFLYFIFKQKTKVSRVLLLVLVVIGGLALLTQFSFVKDSSVYTSLASRTESFFNLENDLSLRYRYVVSGQAIESSLDQPVWGRGLGRPLLLEHGGEFFDTQYIDNSFLTLFYKSGLVALALLLAIYGYYFYRVVKLKIKNLAAHRENDFVVSELVAFAAIVLFAMSTVMLINYRAIIILASMLALNEALYLNAKNTKDKNPNV